MSSVRRTRIFEGASLVFLASTGIVLIALQRVEGWVLLALGALCLLGASRPFARDVAPLFASLGVLGLTPISTDIGLPHMLVMGATLTAALLLPIFLARPGSVRFAWNPGWSRARTGYLLFALGLSYLLLPFYLRTSGAAANWHVDLDPASLGRLFLGTNALGLWDELFFVSCCLAILRRHLPFWAANLLQAVLFTSFLFELGFTGWGPWMIYPFALLQGLVFRKTESLLFIVAIHLSVDLVLYLALIHAHHPEALPIFFT